MGNFSQVTTRPCFPVSCVTRTCKAPLRVPHRRRRDHASVLLKPPTESTAFCVNQDLDRDNFMSAQAAADYGLVDNVIKLSKK